MESIGQKSSAMKFLNKTFKLEENNTTVKTEILAGITTFMTMAYILVVNANILGETGMDKSAVFVATALASFIGSMVMALVANYPIACAPGMGLNAFFTYTVVLAMGHTWQFALCAVFIEGVVFILLTLTNIREAIINCIPPLLKHAVTAGIGLFIAFIGLVNTGLVTVGGAAVTLGNMRDPLIVLTVAGLVISSILMVKNVKGAFLLAMIITSAIGMVSGLVAMPSAIVSAVPSIEPVFMKAFTVSPSEIFSFDMVIVVFTFLFVNLFDTVGCLVGVASKGNLLNEDGTLPRAKQALLADAVGTTAGAVLGVSTVACCVESSAGIAQGGKTGLTAMTSGILFLTSLFFAPIFTAIPAQATGPILILVGVLMASSVLELDFSDPSDAIPAFLTFVMMPLSYSIANGIMFGMIAYTLLKFITGQKEKLNKALVIISILFVFKFMFL